uniref:tetratricopeptide repeat protein n=1 Tax=Frankia sp. Cj3 TaxID=2880976 RepID=UPI001EF711A1
MRERQLAQVRARLDRFLRDQNPTTVVDPEAVAEVQALVAMVPDPTTDLEVALAAGQLHWARCLVLGADDGQQDLEAALAWFASVYQSYPDVVPDRVRAYFDRDRSALPEAWADHAVTLLGVVMRTDDRAALNTAIGFLRQAVEATPADHPDRAGRLSNLGNALSIWFERTGERADLDEAIAAGRAAVEATPTDHPDRAGRLSNLGNALGSRFERTGERADLDEAIAAGRAAVEATPVDHPNRAMYLSNLGNALRTRFERTGERADLNDAIAAGQAAVEATPT